MHNRAKLKTAGYLPRRAGTRGTVDENSIMAAFVVRVRHAQGFTRWFSALLLKLESKKKEK